MEQQEATTREVSALFAAEEIRLQGIRASIQRAERHNRYKHRVRSQSRQGVVVRVSMEEIVASGNFKADECHETEVNDEPKEFAQDIFFSCLPSDCILELTKRRKPRSTITGYGAEESLVQAPDNQNKQQWEQDAEQGMSNEEEKITASGRDQVHEGQNGTQDNRWERNVRQEQRRKQH